MTIWTRETLSQLVGAPAPVVYRSLMLAHEEMAKCTVCRYSSPPSLQQRMKITEYESEVIDLALSLRESATIPFWEAIFSACLKKGMCPAPLLDAALFHNGQGDGTDHSRAELEARVLERLVDSESRNLGLCSKVLLNDGATRHFMFMDFHCVISDRNVAIVHGVCRKLMPEGFVVFDSGDSYHASSVTLLTNSERIRLLGKALLIAPIVDSTYIAHQLQQESSSIRISRGGKCKKVPTVVDTYVP